MRPVDEQRAGGKSTLEGEISRLLPYRRGRDEVAAEGHCFGGAGLEAVGGYEARTIVAKRMRPIKRLLVDNIEVAGAHGDAGVIAERVVTYFSGISIEQNLVGSLAGMRRIESFMKVVRGL